MLNKLVFLILSQSLITCNQYCANPADKTTTCSVPWPLFYRVICSWPCSAWSMGKRERTVLSPEVRSCCWTWQGWGSSSSCFSWRSCDPSRERQGNRLLHPHQVFGAAEPERSQYTRKESLAPLNGQASALLLRSELTWSCVQVPLLLQAGSTIITPGKAQGLVPDSSVGKVQVTQLTFL